MRVVEISETRGKKYKVLFEDTSVVFLYKKELSEYGLVPGKEITEDTLLQIKKMLIVRAKKRVLFLLERMDRTERSLRQKLTLDGYSEDIIEEAISYAKSFHYIDDSRYASNYIELHAKEAGRKKLKYDLLQKGISNDIVDSLLEESSIDETEQIENILQKKHYDAEFATDAQKRKMYGYLIRRGFRNSDIYEILDRPYNKG